MSIKANGIVPVHHTKKLPRKITGRRRLAAEDFVFPEERRFPIPDAYHATLALSSLMRVAGRHGRERAHAVLRAVKDRYPQVYAGERDLVSEIRRSSLRLTKGDGDIGGPVPMSPSRCQDHEQRQSTRFKPVRGHLRCQEFSGEKRSLARW